MKRSLLGKPDKQEVEAIVYMFDGILRKDIVFKYSTTKDTITDIIVVNKNSTQY